MTAGKPSGKKYMWLDESMSNVELVCRPSQWQPLKSEGHEMTQPFTPDELQTLRDACKKRIRPCGAKNQILECKPRQTTAARFDFYRKHKNSKKLNQLVAKIDLQCKPVNKF